MVCVIRNQADNRHKPKFFNTSKEEHFFNVGAMCWWNRQISLKKNEAGSQESGKSNNTFHITLRFWSDFGLDRDCK